jgi:HrpA-like RNA helicase
MDKNPRSYRKYKKKKIKEESEKILSAENCEIVLINKHKTKTKKRKKKKYSLFKDDNSIPTDLPVFDILHEIEDSVMRNQVTIVKAATGSGKSLTIPPHFVNKGMIVRVSLPTIPATMGLFNFVQTNAKNKRDVGYSCHGDVYYDRLSTKLAFCTTKHLINDLKLVLNGSRKLPPNFLLMIDEAHHTSTENKAILKLALYMIKSGFNMKLIVASATLGEINFSSFTCKTIQSAGRIFPIRTHWNKINIKPSEMQKAVVHTINKIVAILTNKIDYDTDSDDSDDSCDSDDSYDSDDSDNSNNSTSNLKTGKYSKDKSGYIVLTKDDVQCDTGGILVFVPGEAEVETICSKLENMKHFKLSVYRLYSCLPAEEILDALTESPEGTTKIVVATNIGESSITIPDIRKVVDMGLQKVPYDNNIGMKLVTDFAPKDKLTQRKGRAGRVDDGDYFPMFTESKWDLLKTTDMSDMDRILPYMIVLEFLDAGLNAQEILEIDDIKYKPLIARLIKLKLIDENNKITNLGHCVPYYPFTLENAIVAYNSIGLIYQQDNSPPEQFVRNDLAVVAILIVISMVEGSQGNSFFWIPKEHRKTAATKQNFMSEKYKNLKSDSDFETYINIFSAMIHDSKNSTNYSYLKWAQDNSMNNKLLSNARKNFKRLIEMTYGFYDTGKNGAIEKQILSMLFESYGIKYFTELTHSYVMDTVYNMFENIYGDVTFEEPVLFGKKKELFYHSSDKVKYKIDGFRSFSKIPQNKIHRLVALQVIETKTGQNIGRYISCIFPSRNQETPDDTDEWEQCSTNSDFSFDDIDFTLLDDLNNVDIIDDMCDICDIDDINNMCNAEKK